MDESTIVVKAGAAGGGTQEGVTLESDTGAVTSSPNGLEFIYSEQGTVSVVNPAEGSEGSSVLIQGTLLQPVGAFITSVTIGGSPVIQINTKSESEVSVVVGPAPASGGINATILITANDGSLVRGGIFSYLALTVSLPGLTSGQHGTRVLIHLPDDSAFHPSLALVASIGEQAARTVSSSIPDRSIEVVTPRAAMVGSYIVDVSVRGIDGRVARLCNGFTYTEEGDITDATPNSGQMGTKIKMEGKNLLGGGSIVSRAHVSQRGGPEVTANVAHSSDDKVELVLMENLPPGSPFPLVTDITLIANTGATIIGIRVFTLVQPGVISSVTPTQGQFRTTVTITGTDLLQGGTKDGILSITLAGTEVLEILETPAPPSDSEITVRANTSPETGPGEVIITLTTGATIISPGSISFRYLPPGVISTVSPTAGTVGTCVTISGQNLLCGSGERCSTSWHLSGAIWYPN